MEVRVYQAGQHRATGEIDVIGALGRRYAGHRSHRRDAIPFDDNSRFGERWPSGAINQAGAIEDEGAAGSLAEGRYQ